MTRFIVIKDDRLLLSVMRDTFSIGSLSAAVGLGVLIDSDALQWIAVVIWVLLVIGKSISETKAEKTISEARAYLDELELLESEDA